MSVEEAYSKDLPEKIMKELKFRYGAVTLDGFEITDVRYKTDPFGIFLKLEKPKPKPRLSPKVELIDCPTCSGIGVTAGQISDPKSTDATCPECHGMKQVTK